MRCSWLADLTHTRPSRITHAVRRLTEAGLVERVRCESDRRSWFASLTEQGREVLGRAWVPHVRSIQENLLDALTDEQREQLLDISRTLLAHLAPASPLAGEAAPPRPGPQAASA
ncbi:MarR family winged helix-turn-helix transcriptional regulator [Nocardiopsis sp. SBT366]|uniref:MarR family winged helix-turn-helix transcriptional regulator n=1 Tax=Nocardiopsis sp. SBT366 TaxID=1580529 RepID=UPI00069E3EE9|nr:MarR family transcriptional regulator [Nocardiopsis sp. SBT366]